jgi:hypothetical protein
MSRSATSQATKTLYETKQVPGSIDPYRPYTAMYVPDDGDKRSGTGLYWINMSQRKLAIAFTQDQTSQVPELESATNHHGRLCVAGGHMFLYGEPLEADQSQGGADTAQSQTANTLNHGDEKRE